MVTQYQARHILVRVDDKTDDAQAKAKIDTQRARIAGGADFARSRARELRRPEHPAHGRRTGLVQPGHLRRADFGAQIAALQDGQVSAPFKSQAGWHIVQREGTRQVDATDQNRRAQVRESIGQRKLEESWSRYLQQLRGEAYVDIRPADAAATAPPAADMSRPRLALVPGEPAGVGPELCARILAGMQPAELVVYGDADPLRACAAKLGIDLPAFAAVEFPNAVAATQTGRTRATRRR